jgi:adenosine deaminase
MNLAVDVHVGNADYWRALPKVLLHEHLDGGLRPQTLLALCQASNISLPVATAPELALWLQNNADSGSLERYLKAFGLTVAAMATARACEQVAFEAAEDARLDGCVLAEFRMAPLLLEPHGLAPELAVEAILRGLQRCAMPAGLIVCAMRTDSVQAVERAARLAVRYAGEGAGMGAGEAGYGVVGFDLAGAEKGFPATAHRAAIHLARDAGLGVTLHAGEADHGQRVLEAIALGATRIGHGVQIALPAPGEDAAAALRRMHTVAAMALGSEATSRRPVHFEVCPTSNTHTGVCADLASHPMKSMLAAGLSLSVHTDNRLISGVTHSGELAAVHQALGWKVADIATSMQSAARASFMPQAVVQRVLEQLAGG